MKIKEIAQFNGFHLHLQFSKWVMKDFYRFHPLSGSRNTGSSLWLPPQHIQDTLRLELGQTALLPRDNSPQTMQKQLLSVGWTMDFCCIYLVKSSVEEYAHSKL